MDQSLIDSNEPLHLENSTSHMIGAAQEDLINRRVRNIPNRQTSITPTSMVSNTNSLTQSDNNENWSSYNKSMHPKLQVDHQGNKIVTRKVAPVQIHFHHPTAAYNLFKNKAFLLPEHLESNQIEDPKNASKNIPSLTKSNSQNWRDRVNTSIDNSSNAKEAPKLNAIETDDQSETEIQQNLKTNEIDLKVSKNFVRFADTEQLEEGEISILSSSLSTNNHKGQLPLSSSNEKSEELSGKL